MKLSIHYLLAAVLALSSTSGVAHAEAFAADGAVNEMNLPWGTEVPPSDHVFTPGPEAVFAFPSAFSTVVPANGFLDDEQVGFFFSVARGDSVTETLSGPPRATSYSLDVDVITNSLNDTAANWDVIINGVTVDNFDVPIGFVGTISRNAVFPSIPGPDYTVELRITNEIVVGGGSHTYRFDGVGLHQIDIRGSEGTVICLDTFCDTLDCGLDNDNIVTCSWNHNCAGTDDEELIGAKFGSDIAVGGEIDARATTTWAWVFDVPNLTATLFQHNGVGDSRLQATDTFTLNSCDFARSGESVLDSVR